MKTGKRPGGQAAQVRREENLFPCYTKQGCLETKETENEAIHPWAGTSVLECIWIGVQT